MPGVKEAAERSARDAADRGSQVVMMTQPDMMIYRLQGLGAMRNNALLAGFEIAEVVMLLENDCMLAEDAVARLAATARDTGGVAVPYFDQSSFNSSEVDHLVVSPAFEKDQGIFLAQWAASSCLVWSATAFRLVGPRPYSDACVTNEDEYNWRAWHFCGVNLWQDTGVLVKLLREPGKVGEIGKLCPARGSKAAYSMSAAP